MTTKTKPKTKQITVDVEIGGVSHKGKGETILEALQEINLSWEQIKAKTIFKVTDGKNSIEKVFAIPRARRIFINKISLMQQAKFLQMIFNSAGNEGGRQ